MISVDGARRRALLVDRHLLGAAGRSSRSIADVMARIGLLHSTDPVTPYLSLHARADVTVADVESALYDTGELLRLTTIRRTVFAMSPDAARAAVGAFNPPLASRLRSTLTSWIDASAGTSEPAERYLARTEQLVIDALGDAGPMTGAELSSAIEELQLQIDPQPGAAYSKPIRITSKVLEILGVEGRIVRTRPTGDMTSAAWRWSVPEVAIDAGRSTGHQTDRALRELLRHYLATFAPATVTDMTWWTGLTKRAVRAALADLDAVTVALADTADEPGFALAGDPLEPAGTSGCVALLPGLDSTTMGWKGRRWYVDDRPDVGVFDRNGNAGPTIWLDGRVVGVWTQRADGLIAVEFLDEIDDDAVSAVRVEAERIERWLGDVRVRWRYPTPITKRLATSG